MKKKIKLATLDMILSVISLIVSILLVQNHLSYMRNEEKAMALESWEYTDLVSEEVSVRAQRSFNMVHQWFRDSIYDNEIYICKVLSEDDQLYTFTPAEVKQLFIYDDLPSPESIEIICDQYNKTGDALSSILGGLSKDETISSGKMINDSLYNLGGDLSLTDKELNKIRSSKRGYYDYDIEGYTIRIKWFTILHDYTHLNNNDWWNNKLYIQDNYQKYDESESIYVIKQDLRLLETKSSDKRTVGFMIILQMLFLIQCATSCFIYNQTKYEK